MAAMQMVQCNIDGTLMLSMGWMYGRQIAQLLPLRDVALPTET